MVTVHRAAGFRFIIYVDDHAPAHIHAVGPGEAKIDISGAAPRLVWAHGLTRADVRRVMAIVVEQQAMLLSRWRDIHG
ncbi:MULTISPECIES: DUF4160 domain-containing protein [Sphingobium]|uniref:DUF4160 domain-containing protein n=1 Tax=Sphingobium sp. MI1205 TaxID=407020 RepID=UPI00076FEFAB|nr:DUF4160 domain-containing protein [Sphingobium sp. MI1205]AMK16660.1 hypothetical protein K663_01340 [Sphingobium sp. MI1205]